MLPIQIRKAGPEDLDGILSIYNDEVKNGIATLALEPMSREDGLRWLAEHEGGNRCVFVGTHEERIVGYVSLSRFSARGGYDRMPGTDVPFKRIPVEEIGLFEGCGAVSR